MEAFKEGCWAGTISEAMGGMAIVLFPSSGEALQQCKGHFCVLTG